MSFTGPWKCSYISPCVRHQPCRLPQWTSGQCTKNVDRQAAARVIIALHGNSTAVLHTSSTMTSIGWTFPKASSSNCAWHCIHVCTVWHLSTSPSWVFRLQMSPDAANCALPAEDFSTSLVSTRQTMADVHFRSSFPMSGTHLRQSPSITAFKHSLNTFLLKQIRHSAH